MVSSAGTAAQKVSEVFVTSATKRLELSAKAQMSALKQHGAEFAQAPQGFFDRLINGLNRLPRPFMAFGTVGLFVFAMVNPVSFSHRMSGLEAVPEPLWWLLGAVVAFYFGARETHYFRGRGEAGGTPAPAPKSAKAAAPEPEPEQKESASAPNPALDDWRKERGAQAS